MTGSTYCIMNTEQTSKNAQWMEKYLSKRSQLIYTSWWRDQLIVLWILNRQAKIYLPTNLWRCHGSPSIFNHSRNLYAGLWIHCCNYVPWWWEKSLWKVAYLNILFHDVINLFYCEYWKFKQKYIYQNTDGVAMGVPASSTTAEIYMQAYERTAITRLPNDGRSISRNVAHLKILLHDAINLLYYECWTDKQKYIYQQTDGVATVGPGSSTTAEIYMQVYERTAITTLPDDGRSISRDVAHLYILVHDVINLLCYECWTDKQKIILRTNWWRCHGRASIFNHSRNLCAGLWIHCCNYVGWWSKKCVSKRIQLKHTCSWRDKSIVL